MVGLATALHAECSTAQAPHTLPSLKQVLLAAPGGVLRVELESDRALQDQHSGLTRQTLCPAACLHTLLL